jgi:carbon monoxide dehydrogenase subunit G
MVRLHGTITTAQPIDDAFAFVADFGNLARWDPGISASERIDDGPLRVGSRFRVVSEFGRSAIPMEYTITEMEAPKRVVLEGAGSSIAAVDVITFEPTLDGGTNITYQADLSLQGPMRFLEFLFRPAFYRLGKRAMEGMEHALIRV